MEDNGIAVRWARSYGELAAAQHGVLTRRQAGDIGLTRYRIGALVQRGLLAEPVPGVLRVCGSVPTWHQKLSIAVLAGSGTAVASHRSAARLHRLDGFVNDPTIEVSVLRPCRHKVPGVKVHQVTPLEAVDVSARSGIRCTTLARTLVDLGAVADRMEVQRALTDVRRRQVDLDDLRATVERLHRPGPTGTGTLLRLLASIPYEGRVPDSWLEELLAACVRDPAIPEVIPQYKIRDSSGRVVAVTDLGIPEVKLGLEGHSRQFHFGPLVEPLDEQRDVLAATCGWELLYLGWFSAQRPEQVARAVRSVVAARRAARP